MSLGTMDVGQWSRQLPDYSIIYLPHSALTLYMASSLSDVMPPAENNGGACLMYQTLTPILYHVLCIKSDPDYLYSIGIIKVSLSVYVRYSLSN